jgi:hypothetical protein
MSVHEHSSFSCKREGEWARPTCDSARCAYSTPAVGSQISSATIPAAPACTLRQAISQRHSLRRPAEWKIRGEHEHGVVERRVRLASGDLTDPACAGQPWVQPITLEVETVCVQARSESPFATLSFSSVNQLLLARLGRGYP